jgi:hypothetical protein
MKPTVESMWQNSVWQVSYSVWPETRRQFITIALQLCFGICHQEGPREQEGLKLTGTHQLLAYADDINILGENIDNIQKSSEILLDTSKEVGLEVNSEKTKYMLMSCNKARQKCSIKVVNRSFEGVARFKYFGTTLTDQKIYNTIILPVLYGF